MCKCLSETLQMTREGLAKQYEGKAIISDVDCLNYGILVRDSKLVTRPFLDVEYKKATIKKDGSVSQPKKVKFDMVCSYCPFCGVAYEK